MSICAGGVCGQEQQMKLHNCITEEAQVTTIQQLGLGFKQGNNYMVPQWVSHVCMHVPGLKTNPAVAWEASCTNSHDYGEF
jgi:hypothetical protein